MCLGEMFRQAGARQPEKAALICGAETVSYGDLDAAVDSLAHWFLREGMHPGDRVAVHWTNSIAAVKLFLACFRAGLIVVPVNARLKPLEAAYVLEHAQPVICFSQPELAATAREARPPCPIRTTLPNTEGPAVALPPIDEDSPALVLYTSGTTARPKGVTHSHRSLGAVPALMRVVGIDGSQRVLMMTSMMHASGMMCQVLPMLTDGGTLVMIPTFDAAAALDAIERQACTVCVGLPAMLQFLVNEQEARPRHVSSLRLAFGGGDSVPAALRQRFAELFHLPLLEVFGMTESVPTCCNVAGAQRAGSIGRPPGPVEARILDLSGRDLPDGEIGEMAVRSPGNFRGYWNDPKETAATLMDGWLMTGDLVRRDADGFYWFEGRKKQIIVRGGSNIAPQEVEEALYQHPAVLEAGVIGLPDPVFGEKVVAFASLRPGHSVDGEALREFVRARLSDHKVPERIVFIEELPKGPTGKVERRALKEMAMGRAAGA